MRSTSRRFLAFAIATIAMVLANDATAELPPRDTAVRDTAPLTTCYAPLFAPRTDGTTIPANAPALAYQFGGGYEYAEIEDVVVETLAGTTVSATLELDPVATNVRLVRFSAPLIAGGAYRVRWNERCSLETLDVPTVTPKTRTFGAGPAVEPPFAFGVMSLRTSGRSIYVDIALSKEMKQFAPLALVTYQVGGGYFGRTFYGSFADSDFASTTVEPCFGSGLMDSTIGAVAHIAGSSFDPPPLSQPFGLDCRPPVPDASPTADASSSDTGSLVENGDETVSGTCLCDLGRRSRSEYAVLVPLASLIVLRRRQGSRLTRRSCARLH